MFTEKKVCDSIPIAETQQDCQHDFARDENCQRLMLSTVQSAVVQFARGT